MKRFLILVVALIGVLSLAASAAAPAASPADLAAMKARLAQIKQEAAALEAKIAAAESPAAGTEPAFIAALNSLPKNLWPDDADTSIKQSLREKWLEDNVKLGTSYDFSGLVSVVNPTTVNIPGKPSVDGVYLVLECGKFMVWGKERGLRVIADLQNVTPADTLDWGDKKTITITGKTKDYRPSSNPIEVRLATSMKK